MLIDYRENTLTPQEYLQMERLVLEEMTTEEQAKRAISRQLYSVSA